jgi:hypothetical protein
MVFQCSECGCTNPCRCFDDGLLLYTFKCHLHGERPCENDCGCSE